MDPKWNLLIAFILCCILLSNGVIVLLFSINQGQKYFKPFIWAGIAIVVLALILIYFSFDLGNR
jgi:hypothetical protein